MIRSECDIEIDFYNSTPVFKLRKHYRKSHDGLMEKCTTCLVNLFSGLRTMIECKNKRTNIAKVADICKTTRIME